MPRSVDVARRSPLVPRLLAAMLVMAVASRADRIPHERTGKSLVPGLVVDRERGELRIVARVATDRGFLEQLVCLAGTREHESLLVIDVAPSLVHAGLLALGLEPGRPGRWKETPEGGFAVVSPSGPEVDVLVRRIRGERQDERPLGSWASAPDGAPFQGSLVFAGSEIRPNPPSLARIRGPGEHYVADLTGSVVGLVTFGDETIAALEVTPDRADVAEPMWQARTAAMPVSGTAVTLVLRPRVGGEPSVP